MCHLARLQETNIVLNWNEMEILVDIFFLLHFLDRRCLVNEGKDAGEGRIPGGSGW